jgi:ribosomal protein S6--L-glutamate ligase
LVPHVRILSSGNGWHVQELLRAASTLGIQARASDFRKVDAGVGSRSGCAAAADRILVRTMPPGSLEQVVFRMDVLLQWEAAGVPVLNPARAIETCVDKYLAAARLEQAGLHVPPTRICQHVDAALAAFEELGGDVVVKPLFGSEGRGIVRLSDPEIAWRTFHTLERLDSVLYIQKYIQNEGWDLRVFVLGGRVLAAMRRYVSGDWRTNVSQGGRPERVSVTAEEERLALQAALAVGAPVCGVDLLPGRDGRVYVLEVNSVPGWRALAPVTRIDVAAELLRFLAYDYRPSRKRED